MSLSDAASSFVKLVQSDTEFFECAIGDKHTEIDWLERKRAQAHKFVDILFDGLTKNAKDDLTNLLHHTRENGLVTTEQLNQVKEIEDVRLDNSHAQG